MKRVREGFLGRLVSELAAPTARSSPGATTTRFMTPVRTASGVAPLSSGDVLALIC